MPANNGVEAGSAQQYLGATTVRIVALVLNALGTIFLFPYILQAIGENDFGIWSLTASITAYFLLIDLGISLACTRFLSLSLDDKDSWALVISNGLAMSLALGGLLIVVGAGLLLCAFFGCLEGRERLMAVIAVLAIEAGVSLSLRVYQSVLRANVRYLELGYFEILRVVLRLLGLPLIIYLGGGLLHLVVYSAIVNMAFFACSWVFVRKVYGSYFFDSALINRQQLRALFDFGKYAIVAQLAELFRYRMDGIFVGLLMGAVSVAHYAIIVTIIDMAAQVLSRFISYWDTIVMRKVGRKEQDGALATLFRAMQIGFWVSGFFMLGFFVFGEGFIGLWVGEKYTFLISDLLMISAVLVVITLHTSMSPFLAANGLQKQDAWLTLFDIAAKVLLAFPLLAMWGFKGIILATLLPGLIGGGYFKLKLIADFTGKSYVVLLRQLIRLLLPMLVVLLCVGLLWTARR